MRRITNNQLAHALGQALASSSTNSLANISQRNLTTQSSTEAAPPSTAAAANTQRITSSMFMNALSEVLRSTRSNNEVRGRTEETPPAEPSQPAATAPPAYLTELQQMREMGLVDTEANLQALIVTNGDLEAAINIILSGGN